MLFTKPQNGIRTIHIQPSQLQLEVYSLRFPNSKLFHTNIEAALLDFPTPRGLRMNLSSLSSLNFATSYGLGNFGVVDGSVSYLSSSLPLSNVQKSCDVDLHSVTQGYRQLQELRQPEDPRYWDIWQGGARIDGRSGDQVIFLLKRPR